MEVQKCVNELERSKYLIKSGRLLPSSERRSVEIEREKHSREGNLESSIGLKFRKVLIFSLQRDHSNVENR